ncbi:MAG: MFS transporter, partial [Gammaproteobacteria bacterium]|nr:MFS transporter [Gammaproteobacteria bacterium]
MLIDYWHFARAHPRFISFGFFLAFLSSAGQTYVIGVFGAEIQNEFGLDSGSWGRIYMMGTLISAVVINWSGSLIDRYDLRLFSAISLIGLSTACWLMSSVTTPVLLILAIFMLRQFGQGLTSHAGITSMARYHEADRGKAIALAAIGFALGEAALPVLAVFAIEAWGWRDTYAAASIVILASVLIALWLLKGHSQRHASHSSKTGQKNSDGSVKFSYTRRQMLSERRFYLMLPAMIAPSLIMTAMFFFPAEIAKAKGWSNLWVTGNYWVYSITAVAVTISSGVLIDRYTARRVVPLFLIPLALALVSLTLSNQAFMVWIFMLLMGASSGLYFTGLSALWAELYGAKHLGAIKSLTNAVMVFSSALGPALVGTLLNQGVAFTSICLLLAGVCLFA